MSHLLWQAFMAASTNCCHPLSHPSSWSHQALHWPAGAGAGSQAGGAQEEACAISLLHCSHLGSKAWILHNLPCNDFEEKPVREMENFQEYFNILYSLLHLWFLFESSAICCELRNFLSWTNPPNAPRPPHTAGSPECSCSWCTPQLPPKLFCGFPLWGSFDNRNVGITTRYLFSQKYSFCSPYRTGNRLHTRSDLIKRDRNFGVDKGITVL